MRLIPVSLRFDRTRGCSGHCRALQSWDGWKRHPAAKGRVFNCREICIEVSGRTQNAFASASEGADRVGCEIVGIKPLADHAGMRPVANKGFLDIGDID